MVCISYLWHWPVIVWGANRALGWNVHVKQLAEMLLMFAIATGSFYAVERPIRAGSVPWLRLSRRRLAIVLVSAVAVTAGISIHATSLGRLARELADVGGRPCPPGSPSIAPYQFSFCLRASPASANAPVVALVGDSTVNALDKAMQSYATRRGWGYVQAGVNDCSLLPLMFLALLTSDVIAASRQCVQGVPRVLARVSELYHPTVWLISDRVMHGRLLLRDGHPVVAGGSRWREVIATTLYRTLRQLTAGGARAIIVITPPAGQPIECASKSPPASCWSSEFTTAYGSVATTRNLVVRVAQSLRRRVVAVSIDDLVCPFQGRCPPFIGGTLVRFDQIHYTASFARKILPQIFARAERSGFALTPHGGRRT